MVSKALYNSESVFELLNMLSRRLIETSQFSLHIVALKQLTTTEARTGLPVQGLMHGGMAVPVGLE